MSRRAITIRPVGRLDQATMRELLRLCRDRADHRDQRPMVLDLVAVSDCDLAGLQGLTELAQGWCGLPVRVRGARWAQFLPAMQAVGLGDLTETRDRIRLLVHPPPAADPAPRGGGRWRHVAASRP